MCGIVANFNRDRPLSRETVERGLAAMRHRGPDSQGIWESPDGRCLLGHCRLSVVGGIDGVQPIVTEDGKIAVVVNGEFYGHREIRQTLEQKGHVFATDSDSEIAIHLYEEYGVGFLRHLRGEFALALYDSQKSRLIAARDRFGIKPLVFHDSLFASEAKALFAMGVEANWDDYAPGFSLAQQYVPTPRTLFDGISQVPPAHFLVVNDQGRESTHAYWKPEFPEEPPEGSDGSADPEEVLHALRESVVLRVSEPCPMAFSLSGGLDSSSIVALASQELGRPVPAFSVSFEGQDYDELQLARSTAEDIGAELHSVPVRRLDQITLLSEAAVATEGTAINGQLVGKHLLSRAIHEAGFKVVLSGEGADEGFLGYAHLHADHASLAHPELLTELGAAAGVQRGIMSATDQSGIDNPLGCLDFHSMPSFARAKLGFGAMLVPLMEGDIDPYFPSEALARCAIQTAKTESAPSHASFANQGAWLWMRTALANYILKTLGDGTEMTHSVQGRVPFLDHHLMELAIRLPTRTKLRGSEAKAILRDALTPILPDSIRLRRKHPFLAPALLACPNDAAADATFDLLRSSAVRNLPIVANQKVDAWVDSLRSADAETRRSADPAIHLILSLAAIGEAYHLN